MCIYYFFYRSLSGSQLQCWAPSHTVCSSVLCMDFLLQSWRQCEWTRSVPISMLTAHWELQTICRSFLICRFRWVNDIAVSFYSPFLVCEDLEVFQLCPTSKPPPYPFLTEQNASTGLDQKEHRPKGCTPLIEVRVLGAPSGHPTPRKVTRSPINACSP